MGFRFWRRFTIVPGITLNLSKSGGSLSFGPRGAKFTIGPRGSRVTAGIPGTGLFYTKALNTKRGGGRLQNVVSTESKLSLGFFKRLVTPDDEEALIDGCRALFEEREDDALRYFRQARHIPDAAWIAGYLCFRKELLDEAERHFEFAVSHHDSLGKLFSKYDIAPVMTLPVTEEVTAVVSPGLPGTLLALVELLQVQGRDREAMQKLERLQSVAPDDVMVRVSLAELLLEQEGDDHFHRVVQLAEGVENESDMHAALLFYKARALRAQGLLTAARSALTQALRRTKDRSEALLKAVRYERAMVYGQLGHNSRMRSDLEKLYAEDPDYEDVAARLMG